MAVNKVIYDGKVLMDVTGLTVATETLAEGATAMNAAGEIIVGTAKIYTDAILGKARLGSTIVWRDK